MRRRKVYRVAAGYAVGGWVIIQVAVTIFPILDLPEWATRFVVFLILGGFPVALVSGWVFDFGPGGFQVTPEPAAEEECPPAYRGPRKNLFVLAFLGLTISIAVGYFFIAQSSAQRLEKSIAVLPFNNFSDDPENAYFADGIQDDVLTCLARIGDLKVISRTSVMPYRGRAHNAREIGAALGVATILEGSVRRDGKRVRVNVQLIDASNDKHLWAQVYDRELTDIFAIQTDLAREISSALKAKLSPGEETRLNKKPTENSEAYLLYLQAHEIFTRPDRRHDDLERAEALYEKAIALDPAFALARARLSQLESWSYYAIEPVAARREKARRSAEEALRLQPDLAEAHLALGLVHYYLERDYDLALQEMDIARQHLPNDALVLRTIAAIKRRQGKWQESAASYEEATSLDPKDPILLENLGWTYVATRDFASAARVLDRAVAVAPDTFTIRELRARVEFYDKGDLQPMEQLLATWPENVDPNGTITLARYNLHLYQRKYTALLPILERSPADRSRGETSAPISKAYLKATVYALLKDETRAKAHFEEARLKAEAAVAESPEDGPRHALLGLIFAGLGRCEEAIAQGKRAVELLPENKDAFDGPILAVTQARISVLCGDLETALTLLERSRQTPAGVTVQELRHDPVWDSLRAHPRFKKMLDSA